MVAILDRERAIVREVTVCASAESSRARAFLVIAVIVLQFCNSFDLFPLSLESRPSKRAARTAERTNMSRARWQLALPEHVRPCRGKLTTGSTTPYSGILRFATMHTHPHASARWRSLFCANIHAGSGWITYTSENEVIPCDKIRRKYRRTFFHTMLRIRKKFNLKIYPVNLNVATVKLSTTKFFFCGYR